MVMEEMMVMVVMVVMQVSVHAGMVCRGESCGDTYSWLLR